jgi:hypothetical protein
MYVNVKDFSFERSSRFLTFKNVSSWEIIRIIINNIYELKFSNHVKAVRLTSIFHSWQLHLTLIDSFSKQINSSEFSIIIDFQIKKFHEKYEILNNVNCRRIAKRDLQYEATYWQLRLMKCRLVMTINIRFREYKKSNQSFLLKKFDQITIRSLSVISSSRRYCV